MTLSSVRAAACTPEATAASVAYLASEMRRFLRPMDKIMICLPDEGGSRIGVLIASAARSIGAVPVELGSDRRWKTILRLAFTSRATAIAAPPLVVLGLTKLAKLTKTPLYFRNIITAGYFCMDWMIDGIQLGLDCNTWGCFDPGEGAIVAGFSCGKSRGVHIRDDVFTFDIQDDDGRSLPEGALGNVVIGLKEDPSLRYHTFDRGRLDTTPCPCGAVAPRLMDLGPGEDVDQLLMELGIQYHTWNSILDCKLVRGEGGLELELITFPGEKLPKLPAFARMVVRPWDPETDVPNWFQASWRRPVEKG